MSGACFCGLAPIFVWRGSLSRRRWRWRHRRRRCGRALQGVGKALERRVGDFGREYVFLSRREKSRCRLCLVRRGGRCRPRFPSRCCLCLGLGVLFLREGVVFSAKQVLERCNCRVRTCGNRSQVRLDRLGARARRRVFGRHVLGTLQRAARLYIAKGTGGVVQRPEVVIGAGTPKQR